MPATRLANSAIDGVARAMPETRAELARYAGSDLLSTARARRTGSSPPRRPPSIPCSTGSTRPSASGSSSPKASSISASPNGRWRRWAPRSRRFDEPFGLAALHVATTLTGSVLLALALARGAVTAPEAWRKAHVDEDFQIALWGEDDEATARRAARWRDMAAAAAVLEALG